MYQFAYSGSLVQVPGKFSCGAREEWANSSLILIATQPIFFSRTRTSEPTRRLLLRKPERQETIAKAYSTSFPGFSPTRPTERERSELVTNAWTSFSAVG